MEFLTNSLLELIIQTSTNLPPDVRAANAIAGRSRKMAAVSQFKMARLLPIHGEVARRAGGASGPVGWGLRLVHHR